MKRLCIILALVFFSIFINTQGQNGVWKTYAPADFPTLVDTVYMMVHGNQNDIWLAGDFGIAKKTGNVFNFDIPMPNRWDYKVLNLYYDHFNSNLWFSFYYGDIVRLDDNGYQLFQVSDFGMTNEVIGDDFAVNPADGSVWMSVHEWNYWGIYRYKNGILTKMYDASNTPLSDVYYISSIAFSPQGDLWCGLYKYEQTGSHSSIAKFDGSNWTEYGPQNLSTGMIETTDIVFSSTGDMFCGISYGDYAYLDVFKFSGSFWTNIFTGNIANISLDSCGNEIFFSTGNYLYEYSNNQLLFITSINNYIDGICCAPDIGVCIASEANLYEYKSINATISSISVVNETVSKGYHLNWTANTTVSNLLYNVYRREQGTTSDVMVAQLSANSTGYTDVLSGAALDKEYYYYIKPQLGTNEGTGKSNEVSTTSCKPPLTLTWSKSTGTLNQLPVGEKIKYSFTITNNDNQAVSDVSVMVSDGTACLLDVPENTNNNGETNYIFDIPRDRTVSEYTRNFTFAKWPYNKLTQNTTITVNQLAEVWDNGFNPKDNGFWIDNNDNNNPTWNSSLFGVQPYNNQDFLSLENRWSSIPLTDYYPDWNLFVAVFGHDACYETDDSFNENAVDKWDGSSGNFPGNCFGFSLGSLLKYWNPSALSAELNQITTKANNDDNLRFISKYNYYQFGLEHKSYEIINRINTTQRDVYDLIESFQTGDKGDLRFIIFTANNPGIQHAVVPYKIVRRYDETNLDESLVDTIYIYDPNFQYMEDDVSNSIKKIIVTPDFSNYEWEIVNSENIALITKNNSSDFWLSMSIKDYVNSPLAMLGSSLPKISPNENDAQSKLSEMMISPSPANDYLRLSWYNKNKQVVKILLNDLLGNKMKCLLNDQVDVGHFSQSFDVLDIAPGYYIIRFMTDDCLFSQPIIIIR